MAEVFQETKIDDLVKSLKMQFPVIPASPGLSPGLAGIRSFQKLITTLDSGFHRSDDFFRKPSIEYLKMKF